MLLSKKYEMDTETLDNVIEGCQLIGFDWKYIYINDSVLKQSKYSSKKELLGYTMMKKYPGIENTKMFKVLEKCMLQRVSATMENEFIFPDKSVGWFELKIHPVPKGIFILSIDITDKKKAEKERQEHIKSLEKMMFITSHRVRQPLTNIMGQSALLNNLTLTQDDLTHIANNMRESIENLDSFTKELSQFIYDQKIIVKD